MRAYGWDMRDDETPAHPPRSDAPSTAVLGPGARVRDASTGKESSAREWLAARALTEGRETDEASDELMNAIARGDLIVVGDGADARGRAELSDDVESGGP